MDLLPLSVLEPATATPCFSVERDTVNSIIRLHSDVMNHFHRSQIEERISLWSKAAQGGRFRTPIDVLHVAGELHIVASALPPSYASFADPSLFQLDVQTRNALLAQVGEAICQLHEGGFTMGVLFPELVYFNPVTLEVLLDVQPFPTTVPFVNELIGPYPFSLYGRHSRSLYFPRTADFYGIGALMYWTFEHAYPPSIANGEPLAVSTHEALIQRLLMQPESFLSMEEVCEALAGSASTSCTLRYVPRAAEAKRWLHPAPPPISMESEEIFQRFLRGQGRPIIAVLSADEATRADVIRQHINDMLEHNLFINIRCRDLPFATLRETISRTIHNAKQYAPDIMPTLRKLNRRLEKLLRLHSHGDNVIYSLADWFYSFMQEMMPIFSFQRLVFALDEVQDFDIDSQRVFQVLWRKFSSQMSELNILFTGACLPELFSKETVYHLDIESEDREIYERVIQCQLAHLNESNRNELTEWFLQQAIPCSQIPVVLEFLIESGTLRLTSSGWMLVNEWTVVVRPDDLIVARILQLSPSNLHLLRVLCCLNSPIRTRSIYAASGLDIAELYRQLRTLHSLGLIRAYHLDSVTVSREVRLQVEQQSTPAEMKEACMEALALQRTYRPDALPPLIALSKLAGDFRSEYYYTIKYYRDIRAALSTERSKAQLETLKSLAQVLGRDKVKCWNRLLVGIYYKLNDLLNAEKLAATLFHQSGAMKDRQRWLLMTMFLNRLDIPTAQNELLAFVADEARAIEDRIRAACFLTRSDFYLPLQREGAEKIHRFYRNYVYSNRAKLPLRLFAELTIYYTILMFQYFPDRAAFAMMVLDMLESVLSDSSYGDLVILLYDAYVFQTNIRISRLYTQKLLEASRRTGSTAKEQVCHLNGMELSLLQGDVTSYRVHKERSTSVDELKRADIREQYMLHQLIYACEWEQWETFRDVETQLGSMDINESTLKMWVVYESYAAFRQGKPLPTRPVWAEENHYTLFVDALFALVDGETELALSLFQKSILANGYHLTAGWSYRELLEVYTRFQSDEAKSWLSHFANFLKHYELNVFWPDYYRFAGQLSIAANDQQTAILHLRRAMNGYQLIEKPAWVHAVERQLTHLIEPSYIPADSVIRHQVEGRQLMEERTRFLNQSLDFMVVIQLCEQVTESLDLEKTCARLSEALFENFPVTRADVTLQLYRIHESRTYTSAGLISTVALTDDEHSAAATKYRFELYRHHSHTMFLDVYVQGLNETKKRHMEHFLSVIRPHIANAIHYLEMMIDTLTGFYQRRYFLEKLKEEFDVSCQYGLDLSLIMLDIDNFRTVNTYGHPEGDKVLRDLSDVVRSVLRKHDIAGRYGGEEILLILPKTDGATAMRLAERLRSEIEEEFQVGRPYVVTVSVGVSSLKMCGAPTMEELISMADDAEIHAKATGKNRVVAAWNRSL